MKSQFWFVFSLILHITSLLCVILIQIALLKQEEYEPPLRLFPFLGVLFIAETINLFVLAIKIVKKCVRYGKKFLGKSYRCLSNFQDVNQTSEKHDNDE